jgi:uncharacterized delta-60 repeat protein
MKRFVKSCLRRRVAAVGVAVSLAAVAVAGGAASAASGDLDPGFGGAAHGRAEFDLIDPTFLDGLAVQPDGGIISVGTTTAAGSATTGAVAYRLHADGTPDTAFGRVSLPGPTDVNEAAYAAVAQPDGKIVVVGTVTDATGHYDMGMWRLTSTGALDTSFGSNSNGLVTFGRDDSDEVASDVALDPHGRIVVAGSRTGVDPDIAVLRLTPEGALDASFNGGSAAFAPLHPGSDVARSVAIQSDGQVIVASLYAGAAGNAVLRITPGNAISEAVLDRDFGGGDGIAEVPGTVATNAPDVAVGADGNILLLGQVSASGTLDGTVVRLTTSGTPDDSFGSATGAHIDVDGSNETLQSLAVLPHGGVAVVGDAGIGARAFVAKLSATSAPDLTMGPGGVRKLHGLASDLPLRIAVLPDGRIIAVGSSDVSTGVAYRLLRDLQVPKCAGKKATISEPRPPTTWWGLAGSM